MFFANFILPTRAYERKALHKSSESLPNSDAVFLGTRIDVRDLLRFLSLSPRRLKLRILGGMMQLAIPLLLALSKMG
jgi:hypothetical protein